MWAGFSNETDVGLLASNLGSAELIDLLVRIEEVRVTGLAAPSYSDAIRYVAEAFESQREVTVIPPAS